MLQILSLYSFCTGSEMQNLWLVLYSSVEELVSLSVVNGRIWMQALLHYQWQIRCLAPTFRVFSSDDDRVIYHAIPMSNAWFLFGLLNLLNNTKWAYCNDTVIKINAYRIISTELNLKELQ